VTALTGLADLSHILGDADGAMGYSRRAVELARELPGTPLLRDALDELAQAWQMQGEYERAAETYEEAIAVARVAGISARGTLNNLGDLALAMGDFERAIAAATEAKALAEVKGHRMGVAVGSFNIASALIQLGRLDEAKPHLAASVATVTELDYPEQIAWCLLATAALAAASSRSADAARLLGAADNALADLNVALGQAERRLREHVLTLLKRHSAPAEVERLLEAGRGEDLYGAVALAEQYLTRASID
jgi:tetratricopeptide (TPR) repeat protein